MLPSITASNQTGSAGETGGGNVFNAGSIFGNVASTAAGGGKGGGGNLAGGSATSSLSPWLLAAGVAVLGAIGFIVWKFRRKP